MVDHMCSYCKEIVDRSDFNVHAEHHFISTRGKDENGNFIASVATVNFVPVIESKA